MLDKKLGIFSVLLVKQQLLGRFVDFRFSKTVHRSPDRVVHSAGVFFSQGLSLKFLDFAAGELADRAFEIGRVCGVHLGNFTFYFHLN